MRLGYNQKTNSVTVGGHTVQGFFSGASIVVVADGGEVAKTQGTDGPSINIATPQGGTIRFTLRQDSPSRKFMADLYRSQSGGGPGVTCVVREGVNVLHRLDNCFISNPGELSSGDKEQAGIEYTVTGTTLTTDNLETEV